MKFSILIANYNNGHFFKDCYDSILNQTYKDWEVIIVDDGSTDDSIKVIQSIIGEDQKFKLFLNRENKGCGFTKNRCANLADGEIMGFLDPDDLLYPTAIHTMVKYHRRHKNVPLITSTFEMVDENLNHLEDAPHGEVIPKDKSYLTYGNGALTHFASFKKSIYKQTPGIDPNFKRAVDQDLYYKLEEQGKPFFIPEILYKYRIHPGGISNTNNAYKAGYWHFIAVLKAYKRRKKKYPHIPNFGKPEICHLKSNYYISRLERLKFTNKFCAKLYFLFKAFIAHPTHRSKLKIKNAILLLTGKI